MSLSHNFSIIAKPAGANCNINCTYCYYLEKENLYSGPQSVIMPDEVLNNFIKEYILSQNSDEVTFAWQGGEPTLLGIEYFKKVLAIQSRYANGKRIHNTFQTNGILLDEKWCELFNNNNFLIGISIDGPENIHNKFRISNKGKGTFEYVIRGIELLKKYDVQFNTLTCIHDGNSSHASEIYKFFKSIGIQFMQFIPVVERSPVKRDIGKSYRVLFEKLNESTVTQWSVKSGRYGEFLIEIFDEWVKNDVGEIFVQIFDISLARFLEQPASLCIFDKTCGKALALEHNGDLYSCDHYVYPEFNLGNIMRSGLYELVHSDKQQQFGKSKYSGLPEFCKKCDVSFFCNGECPKNRFVQTAEGEPGLNYLCSDYKMFFSHIKPYLEFMATELRNGRAPANIMNVRLSRS